MSIITTGDAQIVRTVIIFEVPTQYPAIVTSQTKEFVMYFDYYYNLVQKYKIEIALDVYRKMYIGHTIHNF